MGIGCGADNPLPSMVARLLLHHIMVVAPLVEMMANCHGPGVAVGVNANLSR